MFIFVLGAILHFFRRGNIHDYQVQLASLIGEYGGFCDLVFLLISNIHQITNSTKRQHQAPPFP